MLDDAKLARKRLALTDKTAVDTRAPESGQVMLWDRSKERVPGFGLRVLASGSRSYVLRIRAVINGQPKQMLRTVGPLAQFATVEEARVRARTMYHLATKHGTDPKKERAPVAPETVGAAFARWIAERVAENTLRPRTALEYQRLWQPKRTKGASAYLSGHSISAVTLSDIRDMHNALKKRGSLIVANRTLYMLSGLFRWAEEGGIRAEYTNPCLRVKPAREAYRHESVSRSLSEEGYRQLGVSIAKARTVGLPLLRRDTGTAKRPVAEYVPTPASPVALDALILLILTGWRHREVLNLVWTDVNLSASTAFIPSKTGNSLRPLSAYARAVLVRRRAAQNAIEQEAKQKAESKGTTYKAPIHVFPGRKAGKPLQELRIVWEAVKQDAGLSTKLDGTPDRLRVHDLRHSFATRARAAEIPSDSLSHLLGHRVRGITATYGDVVRAPILAASEKVTGAIGRLLGEPVPDDDSATPSSSANA